MKRIYVLFGSLVVGGVLLTGCAGDDEPKATGIAKAANVDEQLKEVVGEKTLLEELKKEKVSATEYATLEDFMNDMVKNWQEGSEYRKIHQSAEYTLAYATIPYINYFETEISERGLSEDFDELQLLAYEVVENESETNVKKFEDKMKLVHDKVTKSIFDTIEDWAAYAHDILSNPLVDYRLTETNDDKGFEYYLKAKEVYKEFPTHLISEDKYADEIHSKVFLATSEILHLQFARTAHLGTEASETIGLADEWGETSDDMRRAYKELEMAVNEAFGK